MPSTKISKIQAVTLDSPSNKKGKQTNITKQNSMSFYISKSNGKNEKTYEVMTTDQVYSVHSLFD